MIQDAGGRMKPLNTFASELLRKVSKSDTFKDLSADQVLISILKTLFHGTIHHYLSKKRKR